MVARVRELVDSHQLARLDRPPPRNAGHEPVAPRQLAKQLLRSRRHGGVLGVADDRRKRPVDVAEHGCGGGIGAQGRNQLGDPRGDGLRRRSRWRVRWRPSRPLVSPPVARDRLLKLVAIATAAGAFSGLLGVGGGTVIVPLLILWLGYGEREATGTSLAAIVIIAAYATAGQALYGNVDVAKGALIARPGTGRRRGRHGPPAAHSRAGCGVALRARS